jgi:anti-sigma-K factor RskA
MKDLKYIDSGILEAYVLNVLSADEAQEVETRMAGDPAIRIEVDKIEQTLIELAEGYTVIPPPTVKESLLSQVEANSIKKKPVAQFPVLFWQYAVAASVLLMMSFMWLWIQSDNTLALAQQQLEAVALEQTRVADLYNTTTHLVEEQETLIAALADPQLQRIQLAGQVYDPQANALLFWQQQRQVVLLDPSGLQTPPAGYQYQLWYLLDGQPFDAGLISMDSELQKMKLVKNADAFAITLEPTGGSQSPTLEKLTVLGSII